MTVSCEVSPPPNTSFSSSNPWLQLAIDSTSLGAYKTCPRLYYYTIVLGWQPRATSVHLTFGILLHSSRERYDHSRAGGASHDEALRAALAWVLRETWVKALGRGWQSGDPIKNRLTLVRTLVWYLDQFGADDPVETLVLANGKPAVELSFSLASGYRTIDGQEYLLCGHLDRVGKLNGQLYLLDLKTTGHQLGPRWIEQFTPGNQFSLYLTAGQIVLAKPVEGLLVDGAQVGAGFSRFERFIVPRPLAVVEEWHEALGKWLVRMELSAREGHQRAQAEQDPSPAWPMNDTSCDKWGGCSFRQVCSRAPSSRQQWLEVEYQTRVWDPLQRRGDV